MYEAVFIDYSCLSPIDVYVFAWVPMEVWPHAINVLTSTFVCLCLHTQMASFLLYLSDVEEGGETMFPFEVSQSEVPCIVFGSWFLYLSVGLEEPSYSLEFVTVIILWSADHNIWFASFSTQPYYSRLKWVLIDRCTTDDSLWCSVGTWDNR